MPFGYLLSGVLIALFFFGGLKLPSTQLSIKLGMDNSIFTHDVPPKVRRSSFPYGRKTDFCLEAGAIVPVDCFETVPGDSFEIGCEYILKSLPLVVAPFTSYKVRTHWYYCRKIDLWKGAPTLTTKGRSGNISLSYPKVKVHELCSEYGDEFEYYYDTPESLASYLGFASGHVTKFGIESDVNKPFWPRIYKTSSGSDKSSEFNTVNYVNDFYGGVNALPFFMYQKIYRNSYVLPNLLQTNKVWFPDDISDGWRIHYDKSNFGDVTADKYNRGLFCPQTKPTFNNTDTKSSYGAFSPYVSDNTLSILQLRYALFEDDRFTTALPWAQRGSAPVINISSTATVSIPSLGIESAVTLDGSKLVPKIYVPAGDGQTVPTGSSIPVRVEAVSGNSLPIFGITSDFEPKGLTDGINSSLQTQAVSNIPVTVSSLGFDLNSFRSLVALSVWQERNASTQGDYNSTVYSHFGVNPRHDDFEPVYIGGTSDVISFSDVIQTSESGTTPQGHETGLGGLHSAGNVGFFRCPDFGFIMGVMIIQPETVYSQKVDRMWLRETQEDEFFPEDEGLGLQEIFKGEIYPTGTSVDKELFGYQERNTEYKTRDNKALGWFGLPPTVDREFSAYSQSRIFSSSFAINHQFCVMSPDNMRRDFLAVPEMPMFKCTYASKIRAHRPMAYKNVPQTFGF